MIWSRLDVPGTEWARLLRTAEGHALRGTAVFLEAGIPARLDYRIQCGADWITRSAKLRGWIAEAKINLEIRRDAGGAWFLDGAEQPAVRGCRDLDLAFSPATNLLPIRRLELELGKAATVKAAWLRFPEMDLRPLRQVLHREAPRAYRYEADIGFATTFEVDEKGFVTEYPPLWSAARDR